MSTRELLMTIIPYCNILAISKLACVSKTVRRYLQTLVPGALEEIKRFRWKNDPNSINYCVEQDLSYFFSHYLNENKILCIGMEIYFLNAITNNSSKVTKLLLEDSRLDLYFLNNVPLNLAVRNGYYETVKILLQDSRINPSDQCNDAIILASLYGHYETVKILLQDPRVDPSDQYNKAIVLAARQGYLEIVKLLLQDPRVNPSDRNNDAIILAGESGYLEMVKLLSQDPRFVR